MEEQDDSDHVFDGLLRRLAETPGVTRERSRVRVGERLAGRFEIQATLGAGGMGQVLAAFDNQRQSRVALKLLGRLTPQRIALLKREFRAAVELVHPNLVRLYELFSDGKEWFFSMELVEGITMRARLASRPGYDVHRSLFRQLALGLSRLHAASTLHGDLKPSNFLITQLGDRVVLLDFGLSRPSNATNSFDFGGTPPYMSPEQKRGESLSEASDWYAFGVVLHEALTGTLPHDGPSWALLSTVPIDLRELCSALLRPAAQDRPSGDSVLSRLGQPSLPYQRALGGRPALVGRDTELSLIAAAYEAARERQPAMVLIGGPSGIGKSACVEHFVRSARARGALVLAGQCRERESIAFKAADCVMDGIVSALNDMPLSDAVRLLPHDTGGLAPLFPQWRTAVAVSSCDQTRWSEAQDSDKSLVLVRAIRAFGELFGKLRSKTPVVLWLDDLQWSDADSALLLGPVLGGADPVGVLFIGTYRQPELGRGPLLDAMFSDRGLRLPRVTEHALAPLDDRAAKSMVLSLLGSNVSDPETLAAALSRDAGGHPLFIRELVYATQDTVPEPPVASVISLTGLIQSRIRTLPQRSQQLLEIVAVAGEPLPRVVLRRAQALSWPDMEESLDVLRSHRLVRTLGLQDESTVDIHHDRIREIVVSGLTGLRRQQYHAALAHVLEMFPNTPPGRQAEHYEAAGEHARAGRYWIAAADHAFGLYAFAHAANLYRRGLGIASLDDNARRVIEIRRADALSLAGQGFAAADAYLAIAAHSAPEGALELQRRAAEQLLLSGELNRGLAVVEQVLDALGMRKTVGGTRALPWLLAGRAWLRFRGFSHTSRTEKELSREQLAKLDASWIVSRSLGLVDPIRGAEFQTRHLNLALRAGEPRRLLRALVVEASYSATPGPRGRRRCARTLALAQDLARQLDDDEHTGLLAVARGIGAYLCGDLRVALADLNLALESVDVRRQGAAWERMSAQRLKIATLFLLGRLHELSQFVPPLLEELEIGKSLYATASFRTAYSTVAWLSKDRVVEAERQLALARLESDQDAYQLVHCNLLFGSVFRSFYLGDYEHALAQVHADWPHLQRTELLRIGVLRTQCLQMRGAALAAEVQRAYRRGQTAQARELARQARVVAGSLMKESLPRSRPLARLIVATLFAADGAAENARVELRRCISEFEDRDLQMFAAASRLRLAELSAPAVHDKLYEAAMTAFRQEQIADPSRMLGLLAPGVTVDT